MANRASNVLAETKQLIANGEFDRAAQLCEAFLAEDPQHYRIWWNYILADCHAADEKGLVALGADVKGNPIFIKALSALSAEKGERLRKLQRKVARLIRAESGTAVYNEYKSYFYRATFDVKRKIEQKKQEMLQYLEENKQLFKTIRKGGPSLFANSIFGFLLTVVCLSIPFVFLTVMLKLFDLNIIVVFVPLMVYGVAMLVMIVLKAIQYRRFMAQYASMPQDCRSTDEKFLLAGRELKDLRFYKGRMLRIYKNLKSRPGISAKDAEKIKKNFDNYYEKTK